MNHAFVQLSGTDLCIDRSVAVEADRRALF